MPGEGPTEAVSHPDEELEDVAHVEPVQHAYVDIESSLLNTHIDAVRNGLDLGYTVHCEGKNIALTAGTFEGAEETKVTVTGGLAAEDARRLGQALIGAADDAEAYQKEREQQPEPSKSFLRRLIS